MPETAIPQTIHDTVRVAIHDTTVVHDTLTVFAGRFPEMLTVKDDTLSGKDFATWLVQLVAALGAAFLGAWIGGKMARDAASRAIRDEWDMERRHSFERLQLRVEIGLRRVKTLSDAKKGHDPKKPLGLAVGEGLEIAWNLYYRVMEPIFTIGWGELAKRIDEFFARCHTLAEDVKALESKHRDLEVQKPSAPSPATVGNFIAEHVFPQRERLLAELAEMGEQAETLLSEVSLRGEHGAARGPAPQRR